jgi:integrase
MKLVPRAFVAPTRGVERCPERPDPERYLRPEQVAAVLGVARMLDRRWGKMAALIVVAFHTGLRVGAILDALGRHVDWTQRTLTVPRTKNDEPIVVSLSTEAFDHLKRLPKVGPDERIFGAKSGEIFNHRNLWNRIAKEARLEGHVFHELRHGHGTLLARSGTSQQMIMKCMGHKTLSASARYAHANIEDKHEIIAQVFG